MTDIAELGYKVDSSGLVEGTKALDQNAQAAERAGGAAERLEKEYQSLSRSAEASGAKLERSISGSADRLGKAADQAKAWSSAQEAASRGARDLSDNLGLIAPQITDIVTGLASGQRPWMVAIQQGGQLRDIAGGVAPALRAVGTSVVSMINPLTLAAAGVGALALAWSQGSDEAYAFQRAIILTGNSAGVTAGQLGDLAREIGKIPGATTNSASQALAEVTATGRFTADQLRLVGTAAEQMRIATGRGVEETIKEFIKIADDPVQAAAALNQAMHFLTQEQYLSVKAFQEQGDTAKATTVVMQAYADAIGERAPKLVDNVNWIGRAWAGVKHEMSEVWDIWRNIGRGESTESQIKQLQQQIAYTRDAIAGGYSTQTQDDLKRMEAQVRAMQQSKVTVRFAGIYDAADTAKLDRQDTATKQWERRVAMYDQAKKAELEIAQIKKDGLAAGRSQQDIEAAITAYEKQQAELAARKNRHENADDNAAQTLVASIERQITANNQLSESGEKVTASDRLVIQAQQALDDSTNTMTRSQREALKAAIPLLQASAEKAKVSQQTQKDLAAEAALTERLMQLEKQRQEQADVDLMGIGRGADATQMLQRQLDIQRQYLREQEKLDKAQRDPNTALSQNEYQRQVDQLQASINRSLEIERDYQQRRQAMLADWRTGVSRVWEDYVAGAADASSQAASALSNGLSAAEDAFVQFVKTGKLSFKSLADSIIADLARIAAKQAITGIVNMIASAYGGGAASGVSSTYSAQSFGNNTDWLNSGTSFGGGRAAGGPVSGGSLYEVGEQNRPELFSDARGKTYLIPGNDGRVTPMASGSATKASGTTSNVFQTTIVVQQGGATKSESSAGNASDADTIAKSFTALANQWAAQQSRPGGFFHKQAVGA